MTDGSDRLSCSVEKGVARVRLTRAKIHNAFDEVMIAELTDLFTRLGRDAGVRVAVLESEGQSFCAGADLNWMKSLAAAGREENIADAGRLEAMFRAIGDFPKPLITVVDGPAIGGGCGLACCGDIVLAGPHAVFGLSEVRLGILPAVIAPYVVRRLGFAAASRYMLTGERFNSETACILGLVSECFGEEGPENVLSGILRSLLKGGTAAQSATKKLLRDIALAGSDDEIATLTAEAIAERRVSDEGQEGMAAFFEKRAPSWSEA